MPAITWAERHQWATRPEVKSEDKCMLYHEKHCRVEDRFEGTIHAGGRKKLKGRAFLKSCRSALLLEGWVTSPSFVGKRKEAQAFMEKLIGAKNFPKSVSELEDKEDDINSNIKDKCSTLISSGKFDEVSDILENAELCGLIHERVKSSILNDVEYAKDIKAKKAKKASRKTSTDTDDVELEVEKFIDKGKYSNAAQVVDKAKAKKTISDVDAKRFIDRISSAKRAAGDFS